MVSEKVMQETKEQKLEDGRRIAQSCKGRNNCSKLETLNWLMLSSSSGSSVLSSFFPDLQVMSLSARKTDGQKPATYYILIMY